MGPPLRFQLQFMEDGQKPASFKVDGKRFLNTDSSLKLGAGRTYDLKIVANQVIKLREGGCTLKLYTTDTETDEPLQLVDITAQTKDDTRTTLAGQWKAALPISKDETRVYAWVNLDVEDYGVCKCPLVLKVYHPENASRHHGFALRYVQFDFQANPDKPDCASMEGTTYFRY